MVFKIEWVKYIFLLKFFQDSIDIIFFGPFSVVYCHEQYKHQLSKYSC